MLRMCICWYNPPVELLFSATQRGLPHTYRYECEFVQTAEKTIKKRSIERNERKAATTTARKSRNWKCKFKVNLFLWSAQLILQYSYYFPCKMYTCIVYCVLCIFIWNKKKKFRNDSESKAARFDQNRTAVRSVFCFYLSAPTFILLSYRFQCIFYPPYTDQCIIFSFVVYHSFHKLVGFHFHKQWSSRRRMSLNPMSNK